MSNKAHDHVHRLIRSMTPAEKRYFKLQTGRHQPGGQRTQQQLFDAIGAMARYDEATLLKQFENESFVQHFAITKRRLYESILRSLDAFHAGSSLDGRLYRLLHQVELLYRRALYDDAHKMLVSVERMARQHDRQAVLLAVLEWERRLMEQGNYSDSGSEELDRMQAKSAALFQEIQELGSLWDLKSRVLLGLYRHGQARNAHGLKEVKTLLQHPMLRDPANLRSAKARYLFHHARSAAAFATGDLEVCRTHLSANRELLLHARDQFRDEPNLILGVLSNLAFICLRMGQATRAMELLHEFRMAPQTWDMPETEDLELKLFTTSTSLELAIHAQRGSFTEALALVPYVERGLATHEAKMGPMRRAGFLYQIAYLYFGAGQPEKALKWTHRLLNEPGIDDNAEIVSFGRILHLMAQLDLDRSDLAPYTLRNTERFLRMRDRVHRFELHFLDAARDLLRAKDADGRTRVLGKFLEHVRNLEKDPLEHAVFDHLDPVAWAESKLSGRSFEDIVKERATKVATAA